MRENFSAEINNDTSDLKADLSAMSSQCNAGNSNTVCSTMSLLTETYTGEIPSSPSALKCNGFKQLVLKPLDQILTGQDKL